MMEPSCDLMATTAAPPSRAIRGFTLIEVMIVIGMLAFGLLSLSAMQIHAMQGSDRGRHATNAAAIAQNKMEQLQQDPWATIAVTAGFVADPTEQNSTQVSGGSSVERTYSVAHQITDLEPTFTRAIDVRVLWTEKSGEARSIVLSSVRYNREGT